jgi:hypothetical protein
MTDKKPKTSTDRVAKLRAERKAKGHIRREYYATVDEHESLARFLRCTREKHDD